MPYDEETKKRLGVSELELRMPSIGRMMQCGTTFTHAISPAPVCAPARACLASGQNYRKCRVYQNNVNYDPALPSFYGMLREDGYYVTGVGKFDLNKGDLTWGNLKEYGFSDAKDSEGKMDTIWASMHGKPGPYGQILENAGWMEKHMDDMIHRGRKDIVTPLPDEYYADNWIGQQAVECIEKLPADQPWFMQINFSGPHDPWDVTESMKNSVRNRKFPDAAECDFAESNQGVRQNYAAMIENIDRNIGRCIEELEKREMLDNTILIYSADHGEMMGDHGKYGKSKPEQGSIHIPLVIDSSHYSSTERQRADSPVQLQDLAATFLDYAGITACKELDSRTLRPVVDGREKSVRKCAVSELIVRREMEPFESFLAITDGEWKAIFSPGKGNRLYHLLTDPFECRNLCDENADQIHYLRLLLSDQQGPPNKIFQEYKKSFDA
ncbi:Choline-sulfatase [uncultured Clostridium sp.]|nr:Choline-sulfatase [uncultured Clostridium sp.]